MTSPSLTSHEVATLLLSLGVLLGCARLCGTLARRLGQPAILGEILAGVLLGATVLVGSWTKTIDHNKVNAVLGGEDPFDELTMVDDDRAPHAEEPPQERIPVPV